MALIALTSANGSPGVTTSALGLALNWPRPVVVVDADPTGARAIPAGFFRGGELPTSKSIVDLAVSHRQGTMADDLPGMLFPIDNSHVRVLAGTLRHTQARSLGPMWESLAMVLKGLERTGQDAIVDIGRLGLDGSAYPLLAAADLALLTTRTDLPALVGANSWASTLRETFQSSGAQDSLSALLVGDGRPYRAREVAKVLQIPVVADLAWDSETAAFYSRGADPQRKFLNTPLNKSLRAAAQAIQSTLAKTRAQLDPVTERSQ